MKKQSLKKLFAFIISMLMFSALPQLARAQKDKTCPPGYKKVCNYNRVCWCVHNGNGKNISYNATSQQSIAINFELEHSSSVSIKIYDATGRLVKTITNGRVSEGYYDFKWDAKNEFGNVLQNGVYVLKVESGNYSGVKKILVIK